MAMRLKFVEEITEDGEVFIVETYESTKTGRTSVVKKLKPEPIKPVEPEPTDEELAQAEMLLMQAEILEKLNAMEV